MSVYNDGSVVFTCPGRTLWDGINNPKVNEKENYTQHSLKIAIPENSVEKMELEQLATKALAESEFKGVLPVGGSWPIRQIEMAKFGDSAPLLAGHVAINAGTYNGVPPVYSADNKKLSSIQASQMLYPGAIVKLLVSAKSFNNVSKGIKYQLEGIMIVDATAPKLDVSGGMSESEVASVMSGGVPGMAGTSPVAPAPAPAPVAPHPGFVEGAAAAPIPPSPAVPAAPAAPVPAAPAAPVMTALAAGVSYEAFIAQGWTDDTLRAAGYIQ